MTLDSKQPISSLALPCVIALLVNCVFFLYYSKGDYFYLDDFLNFILYYDAKSLIHYLAHNLSGQFVPLYQLTNAVYISLFGLYFFPARLLILLYSSATILSIVLFGLHRRTPTWILLPIVTIAIFSPIFAGVHIWWSNALHRLPSTLVLAAAISIAANENELTGRQRTSCAILILIGVLFYAKTLTSVILIIALRMVTARIQDPTKSIINVGVFALWEVKNTIFIVLSYLSILLFGRYTSGVPVPNFWQLIDYIWLGWNEGFLARALGFDTPFPGYWWLQNLLFAGVIFLSIRREPSSMIIWIGFAIYFSVGTSVIGLNRIMIFGIDSAAAARYYADTFVCFLMLCVYAFSVPTGRSDEWTFTQHFIKMGASTVSIVLSFCVAGYMVGPAERGKPSWYPQVSIANSFVNRVYYSLDHVGPGVTVADGVLPSQVLGDWASPWNTYGHFMTLFPRTIMVVSPSQAHFAFSSDGSLHEDLDQRPSE